MSRNPPPESSSVAWFAERFEALANNIALSIRGKIEPTRLALTCLFAEGHLLLEDVPGVGKTSLARAIAESFDATWHRIQFTPDLLPSDVTGVSIYSQETREFEFHPGPVFSNIVVADEINRASPKTQAALLEVMEERQVTVDGAPHPVPRPFMVIATQNPVEMEGVYRLPEAQVDRFLIRAGMGYPDADSEREIVLSQRGTVTERLAPVLSLTEGRAMIALTGEVHLAPALADYIVKLAAATRELQDLRLAVSPRGSLALARASRARALAEGRDFVIPEDVQALAGAVFSHRLLRTPEAELLGRSPEEIVAGVVSSVSVPHLATRV